MSLGASSASTQRRTMGEMREIKPRTKINESGLRLLKTTNNNNKKTESLSQANVFGSEKERVRVRSGAGSGVVGEDHTGHLHFGEAGLAFNSNPLQHPATLHPGPPSPTPHPHPHHHQVSECCRVACADRYKLLQRQTLISACRSNGREQAWWGWW